MLRTIIRKWYWFCSQLPRRLKRLIYHFNPKNWLVNYLTSPLLFLRWLTELVFFILDLFGISELIESAALLIKFNSRPLNAKEELICRNIFGDKLDYSLITIDESAFMGPRQYRFAYVFMNSINFWGKMADRHFVHELVHIWQYQHFGSVYIIRALIGQHSRRGYDYGTGRLLEEILKRGKSVALFNYEQQADIIADLYVKKYLMNSNTSAFQAHEMYLEKLLASSTT